tara:strand:+ start:85623 stop:86030 length:408 start_codon:yes stop_codon:yes gene_type:complete
MKLYTLHEQSGEPFPQYVFRKVSRRLNKGDSRLKKLLNGAGYTLHHVQAAIKNGECLAHPSPEQKSLGPTYLEQTVSNILRDLVTDNELPVIQLNDARRLFGLESYSPKKLNKEKKRTSNNRYGTVKGGAVESPD